MTASLPTPLGPEMTMMSWLGGGMMGEEVKGEPRWDSRERMVSCLVGDGIGLSVSDILKEEKERVRGDRRRERGKGKGGDFMDLGKMMEEREREEQNR